MALLVFLLHLKELKLGLNWYVAIYQGGVHMVVLAQTFSIVARADFLIMAYVQKQCAALENQEVCEMLSLLRLCHAV